MNSLMIHQKEMRRKCQRALMCLRFHSGAFCSFFVRSGIKKYFHTIHISKFWNWKEMYWYNFTFWVTFPVMEQMEQLNTCQQPGKIPSQSRWELASIPLRIWHCIFLAKINEISLLEYFPKNKRRPYVY